MSHTLTIQTEQVEGREGYSIVSDEDLNELLNSGNEIIGDVQLTIQSIIAFLKQLGMIDELGNLTKVQPGALAAFTSKLVFGGKKEQDRAFKPLNDIEPLLEKYKHLI